MKLFTIATLMLSILTIASSMGMDETYELCFKLLRTTPEDRNRFLRFNLDYEDGPSSCITRCTMIIGGGYNDETGYDIDYMIDVLDKLSRGMVKFGRFKRYYSECAAKIKPEEYGDDYCKKAIKHFYCYYEVFLGRSDAYLNTLDQLNRALNLPMLPIHMVLE